MNRTYAALFRTDALFVHTTFAQTGSGKLQM